MSDIQYTPAEQAADRGHSPRAPWTLRRRLTVTMAALLVLASLAIGVVSVFALRSFLTTRLDQQLISTMNRSTAAVGLTPVNPTNPNRPTRDGRDDHAQGALLAPGQASGTLVAVVSGGTVTASGLLSESGAVSALPAGAQDAIANVKPNPRPESIDFAGLGDYRVVTVSSTTGETLIVGLPLTEVNAATAQLITVIAIVAGLGVLVAIFVGRQLIRLELRPLERVTETATRVSELPLEKGAVDLGDPLADGDTDPRTEVGRVGNAFNNMLGHIGRALSARQASEDKVRRFVADASHELRTPLASIRGYAELTRRGGAVLPDDVRHSLNRIESEATRMTGLVEDLLLLARLDEGRELERVSVDLSRIIVDSISDAYAAGPEHVWEVQISDEPLEVIGDPARLHQVIVNLLANARVHTPAGTEVVISLAQEGEKAVIAVTDNGPGIPADQLSTLFERFTRGDESRTRATGSTGLGLAIVNAVVQAHKGTVGVASEPGRTTFRVELPLS
jgi:two-component system OmpR family sensor kinase